MLLSEKISSNLKQALRSLRHRNYRLFFSGQIIALTGAWMQDIALGWLVYRLTGSAAMLGIVSFCSKIPGFVFGPLAGVVVDRFDKRRIIIITQSLAMIQAFIMALMVFLDVTNVLYVIILGTTLGFIQALDLPARQSFVVEMVDNRDDLNNAIALNSIIFNSARVIGPSLAGIFISMFGEGICFFINGCSYIVVIMALKAMKFVKKKRLQVEKASLKAEFIEGVSYAYNNLSIRYLLIILSVSCFFGVPYVTLLPAFTKEVLLGGPKELGFLMAFTGLGALIGAFSLAIRTTAAGLQKIIPVALFSFGMSLIMLSHVAMFSFALVIIIITGMSMVTTSISCNTLLQTIVDDDKRGRIMSFYSMIFQGMTPLGSLVGGYLMEYMGIVSTQTFFGLVCVISAVFFYRKSSIFVFHTKK